MDIAFNLTRKCNKQCSYCYLEPSNEDISLDKLKYITNKSDDVRIVTLTGGEPLLYEHLFETLNFLNKNSKGINLLTNGLLLDEETVDVLVQDTTNIFVTYNESQPSLLSKLEYAADQGLKISVHHVLKEGSLEKIEGIFDDVSFAEKILFLYPTDSGKGNVEMYSPHKWTELLQDTLRISSEHTIPIYYERAFIPKKDITDETVICPTGNDLFIDVDGLNYPCCLLIDRMEGSKELKPIKMNSSSCHFLLENDVSETDYVRICPLLLTDASEEKYVFPSHLQ